MHTAASHIEGGAKALDLEDRGWLTSGWGRSGRSSNDLWGLGNDNHLLLLSSSELVDGRVSGVSVSKLKLTSLLAQSASEAEAVDAAVIARLKEEGKNKRTHCVSIESVLE